MRIQQQPGFVLHQNPYSETSLVLEVFTPEHGRVGLLAKGARRPGNRSRAFLKPFQPLLLSWSGRGELPVLTGAEPQEASAALALEGHGLYCGFYVNELLVRLLHRHDPHPGLYRAYQGCLASLSANARRDAALRIFEKHLLQEVGYGLVLDRDIRDNAPVSPDALYDYVFERGPMRLHPELNTRVHDSRDGGGRAASGDGRDAGGRATPGAVAGTAAESVRLRGTTLLALIREEFDEPAALREAKTLMRAALARHLGDRPLMSRELFRRPAVIGLREQERRDKTGS